MYRWDVINRFIREKGYFSYLEVGYYKGWSFDQVEAPYKVATDPFPSKEPSQEALDYGKSIPLEGGSGAIYKLTSDDFFKWWQEQEYSPFDIIFIDGLHMSDQVRSDIQNSLKCLAPNGTIVLHDCNPPREQHTTIGVDGSWTGDVYKAWVEFMAENPLECYTIDTDWGIGVIRNGEPEQVARASVSPDWKTFSENREELLRLLSIEDFLNKKI